MATDAKKVLPECSTWDVWVGTEVEGSVESGKGIKTLFIRSLKKFVKGTPLSILKETSGCDRVWFCKEFDNWQMLATISTYFSEVCIEVEPKCYTSLPKAFRDNFKIFLKVPCPLKAGDVVCVGPAFSDESFLIGTGNKVNPSNYAEDKKIA